MNYFLAKKLDMKEFEKNLLRKSEKNMGVQYLFGFENFYGASVICGPFSYGGDKGLWELAVIDFVDERHMKQLEYHTTYDTPITCDVEGYLSDLRIRELLREIQKLYR